MHHQRKLFRWLSYCCTLLLVIYFAGLAYNLPAVEYLLFLPVAWFFVYGILLVKAKTTSSLYKFFIVNNLFIILAGLIMHHGFHSEAGFFILGVALAMTALVITFARKEQV